MQIALLALAAVAGTARAFVAVVPPSARTLPASSSLHAEIRGPTEKAEVLEFGWDGTTALGGAVDDSKPARMLDEIRASGETQSSACDLFNANLGASFVSRSCGARRGTPVCAGDRGEGRGAGGGPPRGPLFF